MTVRRPDRLCGQTEGVLLWSDIIDPLVSAIAKFVAVSILANALVAPTSTIPIATSNKTQRNGKVIHQEKFPIREYHFEPEVWSFQHSLGHPSSDSLYDQDWDIHNQPILIKIVQGAEYLDRILHAVRKLREGLIASQRKDGLVTQGALALIWH